MKNFLKIQFIILLFCCFLSLDLCAQADLKVGHFQLRSTLSELLDDTSNHPYTGIIDDEEIIEWQVYVPNNYQNDRPAGILVYISPTNSGEIPNHWLSLMEKYNLIWVAANQSGNRINSKIRLLKAILATIVIDNNYQIDLDRVYVSGFSGGGRMASISATLLPGLFKGAIYHCGVNFWKDVSADKISLIKNNRFVFITGRKDFNLDDTKQVYRKYKKAGVKHIKLIINPVMGHSNPNYKDFDNALKFLTDVIKQKKTDYQ